MIEIKEYENINNKFIKESGDKNMKYLIISGNPKKDGLTHAITEEIMRGAADGGAEPEILNANGTQACRCCGDGWGNCLKQNECSFGAGSFNTAQKKARSADMLCIITPVYWGEAAEGLKNFMEFYHGLKIT